MPGGRAVVSWDICMQSDEYVEAALRKAGSWGLPVVLCHDPAAEARAQEIIKKFGAVRFRGPNGLHVDMQLLIRSRYFIGDPASSMSRNIGYARKLHLEDPAQNIRSGAWYVRSVPSCAGWCEVCL